MKTGDLLGQAGNSRNASASHLHVYVYRVDGTSSQLIFLTAMYSIMNPIAAVRNRLGPLDGKGLMTEKCLIWPGDAAP